MATVDIKIAYIGGGSRYWARDLMLELARSSRLGGRIDLYDIDHAAAQKNEDIGNRVFARPDAAAKFVVRAMRRLPDALKGADFVVISIEPGPVEMRFADLQIPLQHGILQPVGDTTGPGGIMRALRSIPVFAGYGEAIARHCPRAWVINYTNPMTLCTAALSARAPGVRAFGCCHEVFGTQHRLGELVMEWFGGPMPARHEVKLDIAGVNHFTWATAASWRGHDLFPRLAAHVARDGFFSPRRASAIARAGKRAEKWFDSPGLIAFDLFRRFGALGAAGDRHLAEFVPWYLSSGEQGLMRWGVMATPYSWRLKRRSQGDNPPEHYASRPLLPTGEEGVLQIEALAGCGDLHTNVNTPNTGQMPGAPEGFVVETYAHFGHDRLTPSVARPLPAGAQALVARVIDVQRLTLEAGLRCDPELAFQAILADPLVRLDTDTAWRMFTAMLHHTREQLPGWKLPGA